uniref:Ankyrin repeat domain-containing protein 26 n=1 Tax=Magallana gigas TaxID=29159 RepID=K1QP98_MAGGI
MKKFFNTIKKKTQGKGSYDPQEAAASGGASGGSEAGYEVREKDLPKLHKAAWTGDLSKVVQLVKKDTSALDKENRTALHLACAKGHADIVKVLLEWHAKSNIGDSEAKTPLLKLLNAQLCIKINIGIVVDHPLLRCSGKPRTALHLACAKGHADIVKVLLEWHAKSNIGDSEAKTPLLKAVECGHDDCVKLLIDHNAHVDAVDKSGNSGLHLAVLYNHPKIVKLLTSKGANVNIKNKTEEGFAPLHMSIQLKRDEITRALLIAKANPDVQDNLGRTPLMIACYDGAITPIRMLLQFNAQTIIKDKKDMANMTGQYAASQLLSDHSMKLRRSAGGSSLAGSITPRDTPRGSVGPSSASTTPRDPSLTNMLPVDNNDRAYDSEEETTQSRVSHSQQDDSWADDSVSLGPEGKKKDDGDVDSDILEDELVETDEEAPRISLATKLGKFVDSEPEDEDLEEEEEYAEDQQLLTSNLPGRQQQGSVKSNQSHTSVEDNIPYDEDQEEDEEEEDREETPAKKRTISANRVSFRDESEIREITDDNDTTDVDEDDESGSGPKRPKLDHQQNTSSGYVPTGVSSFSPSAGLDKEKQRAFLADLGIEDPECYSEPEISELSDEDPPLPFTKPPGVTEPDPENADSEWDSTQPSTTPRPGILKNWKQASQEEVEKNTKKIITPRSDGSEWDSDVENELDPEQENEVDNQVKARYEVTHFSDNDDGLSDSESEMTANPKRIEVHSDGSLKEVRRDGSLRGIGDSPITLDYTPSDDVEMNVSPLEPFQEETNDEVLDFTIEEESPRVDGTHTEDIPFSILPEETPIQGKPPDVEEEVSDDPETDREVAQVLAPKIMDKNQMPPGKPVPRDSPQQVPSDEEVESFNLVVLKHISAHRQTTSQWDSATDDVATPRVQNMAYFTEQKSKQQETKVEEEDEDDDDLLPVNTTVQKVEPPVQEVEQDHVQEKTTQPKKPQQTALEHEEDDEDSEWDSEEDNFLPSDSAPPVYGVPPPPTETKENSQRGDHSVSEDIEEESVSEWEIERQMEKNLKAQQEKLKEQKLKEEEENRHRKWEEEQRQAMEEQFREEEIQREAELARQQQWEEEERKRQEKLRKEAEEEQMREDEDFDQVEQMEDPESPRSPPPSLDSSSGSQKRKEMKKASFLLVRDFVKSEGIKSPDTPPTVRLGIDPRRSESPESPQKEEVREEMVPKNNTSDLRASPTQQEFTSVKTQGVKQDRKTESPPLIDFDPGAGGQLPEKTRGAVKEDIIEVTTSFNTASPRPTASVTEQLHNGYDKDTDIHGGQKNRPEGPAFSHNHSVGVSSFSSSPAVNHRRPSPHITIGSSPPNMHSDGMSVDDEDSVDFDFDRPADNMGSYLRGLPGGNYGPYRGLDLPDDDAFSYTSTENGDSMIYQSNTPYGKDVLASMNLSDPATVLKLQEHMHEQNKRLDQERNVRMTLENKMRSLSKEKNELIKKIDNLSQTRSSLEQTKLDMEQKIRNLEYNLSEEAEMRKNAETLLGKTKDQLTRKEEQFTREALEDEKSDLQRQLQNEKNARQLQEQFNEDQQKIQQALHKEQITTEAQKEYTLDDDDEDSEAENKLEAVDEDRKSANELLRKLRAENNAFQLEIQKQRLRHRDEVTMLTTETEELQSKIEELKNEIKLNEEALSHATVQYNLQTSNLRTEISVLNSVLEKERDSKEKLDTELSSLKTRYHSSSLELDKAEQARSEAERRLQHEKEEWSRQLDTREKEELHNKLQAKLDQLQEKHSSIQHENLTLKQQVDNLQRSIAEQGGDKSMKIHWEERTSNLSDQCSRLKEENRNLEARRSQLEQENSRLNSEIADQIRKISVVEANYQNLDHTRRSMDEEKTRLQMEIERYREKCNHEREKCIEVQSKYQTVEEQLRRIQEREENNTQKLLNSSANMEAVHKSKTELEESYQNMKLENAKLEAEVKHERQRVEMLQKDLNDSQKVRNSLEALCSNLKSTNSHLEDKLGEESTTKSLIAQEAEEHKDLWEKEVISRSKLGLRISQYEKQKQDAFVQLEEERRKHRKTVEAKRTVEMKLEAEIDKNTQLQKEVASLKTYLKVAKKRLKGIDSHDSRINSLSADFDRERVTMESTLSSVRQQLQDLQLNLEREIQEKELLQAKNFKLKNELAEHERLKKLLKKLELAKDKLQREYDEYKNKVGSDYVEREDLERVRREIEARYRMELNRKLEDVNNYLEEQARARDKLDVSRDETEFKIRDDHKKIQEENSSLKLKCEQAVAERESREMEAKRYRELYESEMQWRMRLSNQLMQTSDKAFSYKSKLVLEKQKNRTLNTLGNLTFSGTLNGQLLDASRISGTTEDLFTSKLKAELDRSINKHLEAAPHDNSKPVIRLHSDSMNSSYAKSNADYLEVLQRKYHQKVVKAKTRDRVSTLFMTMPPKKKRDEFIGRRMLV